MNRMTTAAAFTLALCCWAGVPAHASTCGALAELAIPAAAIGLPVRDVRIDEASPQNVDGAGYCKVVGRLGSIDPAGWPIRFQLNLPDRWNGKAIQFGGGGSNGILVTGLVNPRILPPLTPNLVLQGYATYGTDAGHPMLEPDPHAFAFNEEAVLNHAYAAYKKTHDIAALLLNAHFGKPATRTYFIGNSEGGREALIMAQRFPRDFDGVIATVPAMNWVGQHLAHYRQWRLQRDGGWLNPAKVRLLVNAVLASCDLLDGIADGVVSRQESCRRRFSPEPLRCPDGTDSADNCLSDRQLAFVRSVHEPFRFDYPIAHGVTFYPGSPYGGESGAGGLAGSLMVRSMPHPGDFGRPLPGPGSVRYYFARDPGFAQAFDMRQYQERVQFLSRLFDATDPDLSAFAAHGKLIVVDYGADYLKSPFGSRDYYQSVLRQMGPEAVERFFRYYLIPGLNHSGEGRTADDTILPNRIDLLGLLERWVETAHAPADEVLEAHTGMAATPGATRPLCRYPGVPQFRGKGAGAAAAGFECQSD